ncbi:MAG: hypothetical protein IT324_25655 [Anaerolineae bacterium]|nr:hypothetical protein [Anaerolineae bacterium]
MDIADAKIYVTVGDYILECLPDGLPDDLDEYVKRASLSDRLNLENPAGRPFFLAVRDRITAWPFLVVAQRYVPAVFHPGVMLVPETQTLLIGAGERLLAYELYTPQKLWEDTADVAFWSWARYGNFVLMSAEVELAAWDINGNKQWTTFVEPPWNYTVEGNIVHLDVMGKQSVFSLATGPDR